MPDPTKRIANWDEKYNLERINAILTEKRPTMKTSMSVAFTSIALMETKVKQVCDLSAVPTIQYPFYLCFGRELWSLTRKEISGDSLMAEAAILIAKWVARGLQAPVLETIRTEVFNVGAPVAP